MRTQQLTFTKWHLHQDSCYSILKKEKRLWSDNKYVCFNETYIDINQEWRGQISFSAHDKIKTNC